MRPLHYNLCTQSSGPRGLLRFQMWGMKSQQVSRVGQIPLCLRPFRLRRCRWQDIPPHPNRSSNSPSLRRTPGNVPVPTTAPSPFGQSATSTSLASAERATQPALDQAMAPALPSPDFWFNFITLTPLQTVPRCHNPATSSKSVGTSLGYPPRSLRWLVSCNG